MAATTFEYKGYVFKPIGNILGGWVNRCSYTTREYTLKPQGYTHEDFYKVAKKHHASCDVFEVDGKLYMPCGDCIAGLTGNYEQDLKRIEDYERWYN